MLKKKVLNILLILSASFILLPESVFAQSLDETQNWIKNVIESFPHTTRDVINEYNIQIEGCVMAIEGKNRIISLGFQTHYQRNIPLKDLHEVQISETENSMSLLFRVRGGTSDISIFYFTDPPYSVRVHSTEILLSKSLKNDNLHQRLHIAFRHLIQLCGGNLIDDTF